MRKSIKVSGFSFFPTPTIAFYFAIIFVTSVLGTSTNTKDVTLHLAPKIPNLDFGTTTTAHGSLASISITRLGHSHTGASAFGTRLDNLIFSLSHSHPTVLDRVVTADHHDMVAWTQERKVYNSQLNAVAASSSPGFTGTVPDSWLRVDETKNSFTAMEFRTQGHRTAKQFLKVVPWSRDTTIRPHGRTPHHASGLGISSVQPNTGTCASPGEDVCAARRRVGEILVRCGVIDDFGMSLGCRHTLEPCPVDVPTVPSTAFGLPCDENNRIFITALADWTSEWLHTLVIQSYLDGHFRFQYQEKPASSAISSRIRRVLSDVHNPLQVVIHALRYISILTGGGAHDNASFLSVPIFRYLHNNGTVFAEDFMFRVFVASSMIGDKTINDTALSKTIWSHLSHVAVALLTAIERYTLHCLGWNVVMTRSQWEETIAHLRSCIKMGSAFDPFSYNENSSTFIIASRLDELINVSYRDKALSSRQKKPVVKTLAPQPIQRFTHWRLFDTEERCPEGDPIINQKSRIIGIAPGSDQSCVAIKAGTAAMNLLDCPSCAFDVTHPPRPTSTYFCGSFGTIGTRFAQTV